MSVQRPPVATLIKKRVFDFWREPATFDERWPQRLAEANANAVAFLGKSAGSADSPAASGGPPRVAKA